MKRSPSTPEVGFHFLVGRPLAAVLGYDSAWLQAIPETSIESFAGTGNPFSVRLLDAGERVVDVGCGAGIDGLIAARMVGAAGQVIGVDMTPAMLAKARGAAIGNVEFRDGTAEALPVDAGSNPAVACRSATFSFSALCLRAHGSTSICGPVELLRGDVFSGAVQSSSAARYGSLGINFRARKAWCEHELAEALAALQCAVPGAGQARPPFEPGLLPGC